MARPACSRSPGSSPRSQHQRSAWVAVWNVYAYLEVLPNLKSAGYVQYWAFMVQPMLFLLTVSALTPEAENQDTEEYFKRRMPVVFGLMAVFIFSHLFSGFGASVPVTVPRIIAIGLCIAIAATRKIALVYVMAAVWVLTLVARV